MFDFTTTHVSYEHSFRSVFRFRGFEVLFRAPVVHDVTTREQLNTCREGWGTAVVSLVQLSNYTRKPTFRPFVKKIKEKHGEILL